MRAMTAQLTIIDGNSLMFRAFYGMHGNLRRSDGVQVNAAFGFCNMIFPMLFAAKPEDVFVCVFDAGHKNFRHEIYPEYKANRAETPADLVAQIPIVQSAPAALGMPVLMMPGFEADDIIATLARHECSIGRMVRVVTGDKDLMQLVSECCFLFDTMKNAEIREPQVFEKFMVRPDQVVDVQALMGDSSDNIPGVPSIGPKTAGELIGEFGSLDNLYANLDAVKNERRRNLLRDNRASAYMSRDLATLKSDVPVPSFSFNPFRIDVDAATEFFKRELESNSLAEKVKKLADTSGVTPVVSRQSPVDIDAAPDIDDNPTDPAGEHRTPNTEWRIIRTESELDAFLSTAGDVIAIDTETDGLDHIHSKLVGISLAVSPDSGVYIPLRHRVSAGGGLFDEGEKLAISSYQLSVETVRDKLWPVLTNPNIIKVGHNLKFDMHILANEGWDVRSIAPYDDTMLLSYVLNGTSHGHGLDELAKIYLDRDNIKFESLFPLKSRDADRNFADLDIAAAANYAAEDAYVTFALYRLFRGRLESRDSESGGTDSALLNLYEHCDRPLMRVLFDMERAGVMVDQSKLAALSVALHEKLRVLESEIWRLSGREFNISSPKQLGEVLFDELKLASGGKNKSTDIDVLNELIDAHPVVPLVIEYRSLSKLTGTYTDALPRQICSDGRVHTSYLQTSTNTGRLSSRDPNLQNIPVRTKIGAEIRRCFVAAPGNVLVSADYSQIQLRLLAHVANVPSLRDAFARGEDIHIATARKIFGIPPDVQPAKDQRGAAKTVNFSIIYGVSPFGLSNQLGITPTAAREMIESYMSGYPEINAWMDAVKKFALEHGYVLTPWGRRIELPGIRTPRTRAYALRAAINAPIQGAEADLMRLAMINIERKVDAKMIMQIHDEMVFEVPERDAAYMAEKIKFEMENVTRISVPLVAETSIGDVWDK
ncbi:DNA polymerase I [Bacteroidia bacterium]|nr:DNA polymerase I [Bacteroidia bacterium]